MLKKTGTLLHETAATHVRTLAPALDKYEVDPAAMEAFLPPARKLSPSTVIHETFPTRIVQMDMGDGLLETLRRELVLRSKIDGAISDLASGTYFPLSTQFENSLLFLPSAQRFYLRNRHVIESNFPNIETAVVNAFVVQPNQRPYGAHNAGAVGFQHPALAKAGFAYPKTHMSFHTAVTPTPLHRQPLVVFEDATSESPNTSYLYEKLCSYDLTAEERAIADKAFYLHDSSSLASMDIVSIRDMLLCMYWEKKYTAAPEKASGYFCETKPGDSVVFDNYKPHGDSTLTPSPEERVTIDIRCFSRVSYPSPRVKSGVDLLMNADVRKQQKKQNLECLLMLLGYENINEFLDLIYGPGHHDMGAFDMVTDGQFGAYNKPDHYLLDQDLEPHYERCEKVYQQIEREGGYQPPKRATEAIANLQAKSA